jgi:hypothetical protein
MSFVMTVVVGTLAVLASALLWVLLWLLNAKAQVKQREACEAAKHTSGPNPKAIALGILRPVEDGRAP